jgi:FK506-binding nuclear protein
VFFVATGNQTIHLTGNYVVDPDEEYDSQDEDSDEEEDYDVEDAMGLIGGDSESDELDDLEDLARVEEIDTDDEEEAPKLVNTKKSKKRPAEDDDEADGLDEMIAKEAETTEKKLSKKQLKKLKNNKGDAVATKEETKSSIKEVSTPKSDKKVQFAKNLEQGPTGSGQKPKAEKKDEKKDDKKATPAKNGVKVVQGVTIDDRKIGTGRQVKAKDKVGMRYIGKLENGKVFDCESILFRASHSANLGRTANKKGPPFAFRVGVGEVIKGWDIGVQGMAVGGERRLTIPASLAYGSKNQPGIPANSTLIFDVKLMEIK